MRDLSLGEAPLFRIVNQSFGQGRHGVIEFVGVVVHEGEVVTYLYDEFHVFAREKLLWGAADEPCFQVARAANDAVLSADTEETSIRSFAGGQRAEDARPALVLARQAESKFFRQFDAAINKVQCEARIQRLDGKLGTHVSDKFFELAVGHGDASPGVLQAHAPMVYQEQGNRHLARGHAAREHNGRHSLFAPMNVCQAGVDRMNIRDQAALSANAECGDFPPPFLAAFAVLFGFPLWGTHGRTPFDKWKGPPAFWNDASRKIGEIQQKNPKRAAPALRPCEFLPAPSIVDRCGRVRYTERTMAVRFIIGRAGSGKTHYCLESVRQRLRDDPVDGPRLVLLVPEQAGLQVERALLDLARVPCAHRADVLSFRRLAFKVLETAGAPARQALSEPARAMVLRHLVRRHARSLQFYRRAEGLGGFFDQLGATITELIQEDLKPEDLSPDAEMSGSESDPAAAAKLHDLRLLYRAYLDYLGESRLDPSQYLLAARGLVARCPWLHDALVWVDGFASLSRLEASVLIALTRICRCVEFTLLLDPDLCTATGAPAALGRLGLLFRRPLQSYTDLRRAFLEAGVAVEPPLLLRPDRPPRFAGQPWLAKLERTVFVQESVADTQGVESEAAAVELVELPSRRVEVDYAVSCIHRWVRTRQGDGPPLRYRDVALIVRDLEPYHDLLRAALNARGIPFFIDRRRGIAHHPLVELLRGGAAACADDLALEPMRLMLKTGLLPLAAAEADELENYLLAYGVHGRELWNQEWTAPSTAVLAADKVAQEPAAAERAAWQRIDAARRSVLNALAPLGEFASAARRHPGPEWARVVRDWLAHLGVDRLMGEWTAAAEAEGDSDTAAEHRQVWRDLFTFLDDLSFAFGDIELGIDEFVELLEQGLGTLTLGLAPPMIDQVLVGSIERSRHPDIRAAVLLGFNDGIFPRRAAEESILNDDDRRRLRDRGVPVGPPARTRILDEALLLYIALTRPSERIVITWAAADEDGRALRVSPYAQDLLRACPGLTVAQVPDPVRTRGTWDVLTAADLHTRLPLEFRLRPPREGDNAVLRGRWNALYQRMVSEPEVDTALRRALAALEGDKVSALSGDTVQRLYAGPWRASVSRLETYAACPFQYFARHVLRLEERAEAALAPVDIGKVHHAVLEDFVKDLAVHRQSLADLPEDVWPQRLQESCERVAGRMSSERCSARARDSYLLRRSAAQLARLIRAQRRAAQGGSARPRAAELAFGFDQAGALPALTLTTPRGRTVRLRGFIDRVDLAELGDETLGIVIDYKLTRDKRLDFSRVYHGLSLQLLGYLLVLAQHGETLAGRCVRPAAALYVSLTPQLQTVVHPSDVDAHRAEDPARAHRPRGLIRAEAFEVLDRACVAGRSALYNVMRKKDGGLGDADRSDAAEAADFEAMLAHTRWKLGELADGILDGDIAVRPYRLGNFSPCSWCAMSAVCRFEMGVSEVRFLEPWRRSEVLERVTSGVAPT